MALPVVLGGSDFLGGRVSVGWGVEEVVAEGVADSFGAVEVGEPEEDDGQAYERSVEDGGLNVAGLDEGHEGAEGGEDEVECDGVEGPAGSDDDADGGEDSGEHDEDGGDGHDQESEVKGWWNRDGVYWGRRGRMGAGAQAGDAVKHAVQVKERDEEEDGREELKHDEEQKPAVYTVEGFFVVHGASCRSVRPARTAGGFAWLVGGVFDICTPPMAQNAMNGAPRLVVMVVCGVCADGVERGLVGFVGLPDEEELAVAGSSDGELFLVGGAA